MRVEKHALFIPGKMINKIQHMRTSAMALIVIISFPGCKETAVIYPERKDLVETVYASGKIVPEDEYELSALSNGTITKKLVKDGDTVTKGQLLYIVSNEAARERYDAALKSYQVAESNLSLQSPLLNDLKLSLSNAVIKFTNDSTTYERWKNLWNQNIGTKSNLDNAFSNYQISLNQKKIAEYKYNSTLNEISIAHSNALSQLTSARKDLNEYYIRSTREGVVYRTFREVGETVRSNEVIALLGERHKRILRLAVDQQDINRIRTGQQVLIQSDVTGGKTYEATITCIFPVMNEIDQTFRVDARFSRLPEEPFIHSSIEANIIVQKKSRALVIPRAALAGEDSVWTNTGGKQSKVGVRTGIATIDYVEILSGIDENTEVLLNSK